MANIISFDSEKEFKAYIKSKAIRKLGTGSEGTCYEGSDGLAYKDLSDGPRTEHYVLEDIVTTCDSNNESFAFPHILFIVENELLGYTSKMIPKNDLDDTKLLCDGIAHIDFDKLYNAYLVMRNNAIALAQEGIRIYDLSCNVVFDGNRLVGIDTCKYSKTEEDVSEDNAVCVDDAIKDAFWIYAYFAHKDDLDRNMDVLSYLKMVESKYSNKSNGDKPKLKRY